MTKLTDECLGAVTRLLQKALGSRVLESSPANAVGVRGERTEHGFAEIPRRLYDIYMEGIRMISEDPERATIALLRISRAGRSRQPTRSRRPAL